MVAAAILYFRNCEISLADKVQGAKVHRHPKLYQNNQPIHCGDIVIFQDGRCHLGFV